MERLFVIIILMQSADVSLFYQHSEEKHAAQLEEKSRDHKNRRDRYLLLLFYNLLD